MRGWGYQTAVVQSLAIMEVVHSLLGFVRSPLFTTAIQVWTRYVLVWGVANLFKDVSCLSCFKAVLTADILHRPKRALSTHQWSSPGPSPRLSATHTTPSTSSTRSPTFSSGSATPLSTSCTPPAQVLKPSSCWLLYLLGSIRRTTGHARSSSLFGGLVSDPIV